jgi:hypothetical protein
MLHRIRIGMPPEGEPSLTASPNPVATEHLPFFITAPGETDVLFNVTMVIVIGSIVLAGVIVLTIHSLPERMAHKSKKIQLDIVAVLCLLALFTHQHAFWFAALLLAFIEIPDFLTPFTSIASSVKTIARQGDGDVPGDQSGSIPPADHVGQDGKASLHA